MSLSTRVRTNRVVFGAVALGLVLAGASGYVASGYVASAPAPTLSTPSPLSTESAQRAVPTEVAPAVPVPLGEPVSSESQVVHPEVGECIDVRKDRAGGRESIVRCDEVHDDEAYARFTVNSNHSAAYPGEAVVERLARDGCQDRFTDFIGIRYEDSVFEFFPMFPSDASWAAQGDRTVTCLVWYPADSLTTSLQGAGY